MVRNARGNLVKPPLLEVVNWVKNAWDKISDDTIKKALRSSYLDKNHPFEESSVAKHERLGPLVLQKLADQQDNVIIESNIFEDVPEDDELAVDE